MDHVVVVVIVVVVVVVFFSVVLCLEMLFIESAEFSNLCNAKTLTSEIKIRCQHMKTYHSFSFERTFK